MPQLKIHIRRSTVGDGLPVAWVELDGFLDASTVLSFDNTLQLLHREGQGAVVLDFRAVLYANSSAIGAILNYRNLLLQEGRELALMHLSPQVRTTLDLLGLSAVLPCLANKAAVVEYLTSAPPGKAAPPPAPEGAAAPSPAAGLVSRPAAVAVAKRHILMIAPEENRFTDILKMRLLVPRGRFEIVASCSEALHRFDEVDPDLIILEDPMKGSEDFLWAVKTEKGKSVVPVIKLYWTGTDIETRREFKIWEDDFLLEPFEVMELFALSEAELRRFPEDRKVLLHLAHFEFRTRKANIARAGELAASLLGKSGLAAAGVAAMSAAFAEAVENAARHAHGYAPEKRIDVTFLLDREKVAITVSDEGPGFDFAPHLERARQQPPVPPERLQQSRGGLGKLGIPLMARCVDQLEYLGSGNSVRLTKRLR
ncbi:MAG: STAS domain-containing protein [Planctomycetes bacterium]|nr:STAS domain-containing protein [Planctomycetota bacterium]